MKRLLPMVAGVALLTAGCGGGLAKVKGQIVENGQPTTFPPTTVSVQLSPIGADGKADPAKVYGCVVNPDGTFELVASGGEVPAGMYQVAIEVTAKGPVKAKAFSAKGTPLHRELKSGQNVLTIDLAKPEG